MRTVLSPFDIVHGLSEWFTINVGMGVSGGYQAARRGPSMCPGGEEAALNLVLPLLEKVAAKDARGRACVGRAGMGGSGHYVKMIHNGIEHGESSL